MTGKRTLLFLILTIAFYTGLGLWFGASNLQSDLVRLPFWWWLIAPSVALLGHGLLIQRWQMYLQHLGHPLSLRAGASIYTAGLALIAAPGRSGEALRGLWLQRRHGIPLQVGVGITLAERLTDLASALLVLSWGLGRQVWMAVLAGFVALASGSWLLTHPQLIRQLDGLLERLPIHPRWHGLLKLFREALLAFGRVRQLMQPLPLLIGTMLASLCWLLEVLMLQGILSSLGTSISLPHTAVIRTAMAIGGVLSLLPAGIGTSEATAIGLAMAYGADRSTALAATLVLRVATLAVPCSIGLVALLLQRNKRQH